MAHVKRSNITFSELRLENELGTRPLIWTRRPNFCRSRVSRPRFFARYFFRPCLFRQSFLTDRFFRPTLSAPATQHQNQRQNAGNITKPLPNYARGA